MNNIIVKIHKDFTFYYEKTLLPSTLFHHVEKKICSSKTLKSSGFYSRVYSSNWKVLAFTEVYFEKLMIFHQCTSAPVHAAVYQCSGFYESVLFHLPGCTPGFSVHIWNALTLIVKMQLWSIVIISFLVHPASRSYGSNCRYQLEEINWALELGKVPQKNVFVWEIFPNYGWEGWLIPKQGPKP